MSAFSIGKLFFFIFWFAWGINTLSRLSKNEYFCNSRYRQWIALAAIFTGPVVEAIFLLLESRHSIAAAAIEQERAKTEELAERLQIIDSNGQPVFSEKSSAGGKNFDYIRFLLADAVSRRASDIFINPGSDGDYSVRFRQDGALHLVGQISQHDANGCLSIVKVASSMDISEHRRPQDGAFSVEMDQGKISFRVATVGSYGGEKMAIRVLGSIDGIRTLREFGMTPENLELLKSAVRYPSGLVLICGPTGSGKTSTFYALIKEIDYQTKNVVSIEDPIESEIPRVSQMEVNNQAGITFASLLRNALRQNPDIMCVGEIRDEETAGIAVQAAQTGHLIVATIHSNDNLGTLDRLKTLGLPLKTVAETLRVIVSQRLVRQLCPHCKERIELPESLRRYFESAGLPTDNVYRAVGCPRCSRTGYKGRLAIFDILVLTNRMKKVLESESVTPAAIREAIEKEHGLSLLALDGYRLAAEGKTSLEEIARVALKEG